MPAAIFVLLLIFGLTPFVIAAVKTTAHHETFLGVAGVFPFDQDQYLAFVASAHDGLIRNLYGLTGSAVFVDPVWSPTGVVEWLTGLGPACVMAFWNVVGAGVLYAGGWRLVSRHVPAQRPWRRSVCLLVALFGAMTLLVGLGRSEHSLIYASVGLDMVPAQTLWGYAPMAIAIGLMPFAIEGMEKIIEGSSDSRSLAVTTAACLLPGWLHPWQGITLLLIWLGLLAWRLNDPARSRLSPASVVLVTAALIAAPLYFEALPLLDASWAGFSHTDTDAFALSWQYLVLGLAPAMLIAVPGALALRHRREARGVVLWPVAVLLLAAARPPETLHSFDGLAFPLAVLTLADMTPRLGRRARWRGALGIVRAGWVAFTLGSAVLITVALIGLIQSPWITPLSGIRPADAEAAQLAARHAQGRPVLTPQQLGVQLPIVADVAAWSGDAFWTPNAHGRELEADRFFLGQDTLSAARAFVAATGARAIIEPCGWRLGLRPILGPSQYASRTVGCARVYWRI
jgi:hypothetical protein